MKYQQLKVQKRKELGRKVKKIRKDGLVPGNIYGRKVKSTSIALNLKEFEKVFQQVGETNIVELSIGGKKRPTLIHNIQKDPVSDIPIHVDFLQVDLKQKVTAQIPIEIAGESQAEKQGEGTVVQYIDKVEVEALPAELPERFELDLSKLIKVDDQIQVKDLNVDRKKVEVKNDGDQILVKIEPLRKEEEEPIKEEVEEETELQEDIEDEGEQKEEKAEEIKEE